MQNARCAGTRGRSTAGVASVITFVMCATVLVGCGPSKPSPQQQLKSAYRDLEQQRYDQAFAEADAFLRQRPSGPGSGEALYLQGRVYEARAEAAGAAGRTEEARGQLTVAANTYLRAMHASPPP